MANPFLRLPVPLQPLILIMAAERVNDPRYLWKNGKQHKTEHLYLNEYQFQHPTSPGRAAEEAEGCRYDRGQRRTCPAESRRPVYDEDESEKRDRSPWCQWRPRKQQDTNIRRLEASPRD